MTDAQQKEYLKKYEAELISPDEATEMDTRRVERRLPLPRLREDLCSDGQGFRRGHAPDDEGTETAVRQRNE